MALAWRSTEDGYVADGYWLVAPSLGEGAWTLRASSMNGRRPGPVVVTTHDSARDAMHWAVQLERGNLRWLSTRIHFAISIAALVLFVVAAEEIGTLLGLGLVAAALYLTLRSAANGVGLVLQDAWGWTRPGQHRASLLERVVDSIAIAVRRRSLRQPSSGPETRAVRPLEPAGLDREE